LSSANSILNISDAAALGIHAAAVLAAEPKRALTTSALAKAIRASANHLSKVLQKLRRAGILRSNPGPGGGFILAKAAAEVTLLGLLEAVDGPLPAGDCLMDGRTCRTRRCLFGPLLGEIRKLFRDYLAGTRLSSLK